MLFHRLSLRREGKLAYLSPNLQRSLAYLFAPCKVGSKAANNRAVLLELCWLSRAQIPRQYWLLRVGSVRQRPKSFQGTRRDEATSRP